MSAEVFEAAPAKLNLFLHVGARHADGFHQLESLAAFTCLGDEVSLAPDDRIALSLAGPFGAQLPADEGNLALRATRQLAEIAGIADGVRISLRKQLPVASGLGGGSADAAAVLRGLVRLWKLDIDCEALRGIAAPLGADVPVCIDSVTAWMEGRGDRIRALPRLPEAGVLLVNPGVTVLTGQVFAALDARRGLGIAPPPETSFADVHTLVDYLRDTTNDLEQPARHIAPVIGEALQELNALPGLLLARMSGSGATCFGLFANQAGAHTAGQLVRVRYPDWWVVDTRFVGANGRDR